MRVGAGRVERETLLAPESRNDRQKSSQEDRQHLDTSPELVTMSCAWLNALYLRTTVKQKFEVTSKRLIFGGKDASGLH